MDMKRISSSIWPYVIAGTAIGGAVGYVIMTDDTSIDVSRRKKDAFLERIGTIV